MTKVLFDATMLGLCTSDVKHQTGVYRMIDNVAKRIVASGQIKVDFYADSFIDETKKYLAFNTVYKNTKLIDAGSTGLDHFPTKFEKEEARLTQKIERATSPYTKQWYTLRRSLLNTTHTVFSPFREKKDDGFEKFDIFHSSFLPINDYFLSKPDIKRFLTVHDLIAILFPNYFIGQPVPVKDAIDWMKPSDFFFTNSQYTKSDLCNYRKDVNPDNVFVTHLAADPQIFYHVSEKGKINDVLKKHSIPTNQPYFLGVSTLEPRKNIDQVIRCFSQIVQQERLLKDTNLVLVGKRGWDYQKIFDTLDVNPAIRNKVFFTGFVDNTDLAPIYCGSLGFMYMSLYEGFGLPPLEAMQCGVPVITSNTSSLPEVVGDAGITLDPKDDAALCQAILNLYQDSALRERMRAASLQQAAKFSWDKTVQQTIQAYKYALNT